MTDSERAAVFVTLGLLCAAVATMKGRNDPFSWFYVVGAIGWLIKGVFAYFGK